MFGLSGLSGVTLASASGHRAAHRHASATPAVQVISYRGYHVRVPKSWPVYRLATDPARCVLFNRHAVYLGTPGSAQRCPVHALGKTEALLVQPLSSTHGLPPQTSVQSGNTVRMPSGRLAAQDSASQTVRLALPRAGVQVTATYGHNPGLIRGILRGARLSTVAPSASRQAAPVTAAPDRPGNSKTRRPTRHTARHSSRHTSRRDSSRHRHVRHGAASARPSGTRSPAPTPSVAPSKFPMAAAAAPPPTLTGRTGAGLGFDTCTVPSVATMRAWLASPFRMAGTYLGGDNWACGYGNFSRSWVSQVAAQGWRFIPLWVGPQAPCTSIGGTVRINPSQAAAEGRAQAASAVSTAAGFGFAKGSPIYFDMEGYNNTISSCTRAVLGFLSAWTQGLHRAGYVSGVYSSASSGVADLAAQYGRSGYTEPDNIWFAEWNRAPVLSTSYLSGRDWPGSKRVHQFNGPNVEKFGGVSVNIDEDFLAGTVATPNTPPGRYVLTQPQAVAVAPGRTGQAQLVISAPSGQSAPGAVGWMVKAASGLTVTPSKGVASPSPGHSVTVTLRMAASSSARWNRYNLPVYAGAGGRALPGTSVLVTVTRHIMATPRPVVLYAADHASMLDAAAVARQFALPAAALTGSFQTAWRAVSGGRALVLALGQAAINGLYTNPCGWSNPAHMRKGSTPFTDLGGPLRLPPGKNYFEDAAGVNPGQTAQITAGLIHYALTGAQPSPHAMPPSPSLPTGVCRGVSSIPVP